MLRKLTKKEKEAYSIVQSIRGKRSAEVRGTKAMAKAGRKGGKAKAKKLKTEQAQDDMDDDSDKLKYNGNIPFGYDSEGK